ncbi:MAG: hypothetical protein HYR55_12020 [Acidobacteria bacterium]|nr:hypothetical protein [Acidobacteriota bacterium]MBI3657520.1 hypothetical protein [Acidobacteriota bacterium]
MRRRKITLILGPGGLPGGAFEIGGLLALEDFIGADVFDVVDEFQGSSCGAVIAFAIMSRFDTSSLYSALHQDHPYYFKLSDFYDLNLKELCKSALVFPVHVAKILGRLVGRDNVKLYERLMVPIQEMPLSGLFTTEGIQDYIQRIIDDFSVPSLYGDFCKKCGKDLYLLTTDLSSGEPLILDPAHHGKMEIKKALAASATVAPLFKPIEISNSNGKRHKLADGAFAMSLGIRHAYERGGSLIIYFNPLKPTTVNRNVRNVFDIFEQLYRIPAHTRKVVSEIDHVTHHPGTLIGFEPDTDSMFHNLFRSDLRLDYADHGYLSTLNKLHRDYTSIRSVFERHGLSTLSRRRMAELLRDFEPGKTLPARRKSWMIVEQNIFSSMFYHSMGMLENWLTGFTHD